MKRWTNVLLALCVAGAASACGGDRATTADDKAVGTAGTVAEAKKEADNKAGRTDRDFVGDMMADGRAEVSLGKLAQQKTRNQRVKEFAAMMIRDHQRAGTELKTLASQINIDMSNMDADTDHGKATYQRLSQLSAMQFDREYMKAMVEDHKRAVKDVEDKADGSDNDHVKQWAAKTVPTLKKHLAQAKDIAESLEKPSGS